MIGEASGHTSTMPPHVRSSRACAKIGNSSIAAAIWCSMMWNAPRCVYELCASMPGAHHQLALVGLRDVHVDGVRHHDAVRAPAPAGPRPGPAAGGSAAAAADRPSTPAPTCGRPRPAPPCSRRIVPRVVSTPATRPPSPRTNPVTSQCSTMSTPWRSAPRANAHATLSCRAMPPRRCSVAAEHRVARVGRDVHDRAELLDLRRVEPLGVDAVQPVRVHPPHRRPDVAQVVREVQDAALAELDVEVERLLEPFPELQRVLVDRRALVPEVVRADHGGVAGHVAAAQPALLDHGDVGDAVVLRQVVGGGQTVPAGAHDDHVVARTWARPPASTAPVLRSSRSALTAVEA